MKDLKDIINVAWSGKKLRGKTIADTVKSAVKSFSLNEEEANDLEKVLIEFVTGISSPEGASGALPVSTALDYLEDAVTSANGRCTLGGKEDCSASLVRDVMRNYIICVVGYRD